MALSATSLRVEMETDKHHAGEAQQEILSLKGRLARALTEQIAAKHREDGVFSATVTDLHAQIEQLLVSQSGPGRQLRDTQEEIGAARRLNRTLIRERNSGATERQRRAPSRRPIEVAFRGPADTHTPASAAALEPCRG